MDIRDITIEPFVAFVRYADCIGCTKCIRACPFDAIAGARREIHTIIQEACTGCGLCIPPCPTDCIELHETAPLSETEHKIRLAQAIERFKNRDTKPLKKSTLADRQKEIKAACKRSKKRRQQLRQSHEKSE